MANILLIETTTNVCSVALGTRKGIVCHRESRDEKAHASLLTVFIQDVLTEAGLEPGQLDAVAVSQGPGSYTGLRIGVSAAKGICYGLEKPLIALGTLHALAFTARQIVNETMPEKEIRSALFCALMDARRMEVYSAVFNYDYEEIARVEALVVDKDSFQELLTANKIFFFGNGAAKCKEVIHNPNAIFLDGVEADARSLNYFAQLSYEQKNFVDVAYFEPFYLKDFVALKSTKNVFGLKTPR